MLNQGLFEGKYRILGTLGQGGMGRVYLAENIKLGSLWAIKQISKTHAAGSAFPAESNILRKLNHPSLPRIFDIVEDESSYYIIVDYIEGESLDKKLREYGSFPEETVLEWAKQICDVLVYLHEFKPNPIIYRDLKPSNIILTGDGTIKLIDFGIAREYKKESSGDTIYIGTRGYAAPEQYGSGQTSAVTDIYSFGVTVYEILTGEGPASNSAGIKQGLYGHSRISTEMMHIIEKCTRIDPSQRFQSSRELLECLNKLGKDKGTADNAKTGLNKGIEDMGGSFKKLVLTVWDNAEFGCELAYLAARTTGYSVLLADLDLLAPRADLYLNIRKNPDRITSDGIFGDSGINIVMNSLEKSYASGNILAQASVKRRELGNLFVITGNYKLENYEYYKDESLHKFLEKCYRDFDITILLVNKSIYDSYTVISLIRSDYNIVAVRAELDKIREYNEYIMFLSRSQQIPPEKTKFIAFEYDEWEGLCKSVLAQVTGYNLIGKVGYSKRRIKYRNLKIPYVRRMENNIVSDYINIMSFFNIMKKPSLSDSVRKYLNRSFAVLGLKKALR
jgi:hypothetical protein